MKTVLFISIKFVVYIYLGFTLADQNIEQVRDLHTNNEDYGNYLPESYENRAALKILSRNPQHLLNQEWRNKLQDQAQRYMSNAREYWDGGKRHSRPVSAFLYKKRGRTHSRLLESEAGDPLKYMIFPKNMRNPSNRPQREKTGLGKRPFCNGFYGCHNYPKKLTQNPRINLRMDPTHYLQPDYDELKLNGVSENRQDNNLLLNKRFKRDLEDYSTQEDLPGLWSYVPASELALYQNQIKHRVKRPFCNAFTGCNNMG